jgi:hypothetical protein
VMGAIHVIYASSLVLTPPQSSGRSEKLWRVVEVFERQFITRTASGTCAIALREKGK